MNMYFRMRNFQKDFLIFLGNDCALMSSVYFLSQTVVASFTSLLTSSFGNYAIIVTSSICSFITCLLIAVYVIFPPEENQKDEEK